MSAQARCRSPEAVQALSQLLKALEQACRTLEEATTRTGGLEGGYVQTVRRPCPECTSLEFYWDILNNGWLYQACRVCGRAEPWCLGIVALPVLPGLVALLIGLGVCGLVFVGLL